MTASVTPPPNRRGWRQGLLSASIILNLFFIAVIGGHVFSPRFNRHPDGTVFSRTLANIEASLSPTDAAAFRSVIRRDAPRYATDMAQLAEARRALARNVAADHFDPAGTREALATWRTRWNSFMTAFSDTLIDALGQISPDGRRRLVADRRRADPELQDP